MPTIAFDTDDRRISSRHGGEYIVLDHGRVFEVLFERCGGEKVQMLGMAQSEAEVAELIQGAETGS